MKQATHKGYWICVTLESGESKDITGLKHEADALYTAKKYMRTPNVKHIGLFVGTKLLGEMSVSERRIDMATGTFAAFAEENGTLGKTFLPFASGSDKEMIAAFALPFFITGVRTRVSTFPDANGEEQNEILYDLELDTSDPTYVAMSRVKDIKPGYCFSVTENVFRVKQNQQLIEPAIEAGSPMRAKLVKRGRAWSFADAS